MKNIKLVLLLAFCLPAMAIAEGVNTAGYSEKTPEATLKAIHTLFSKEFSPDIKGDNWVKGSMNFNKGSEEYNKLMTARMNDDFDQPVGYPEAMAAGKKLWETPFANGKKMADCFAKGGKGAANDYPRVNAATGKVEVFEHALNKCRTDNGEKALDYGDMKTMGALSIVARRLSDGERIKIEVKTDAEKAAFNRGKEIFYGRVGKFEQACAHCHIQKAGKIARTEDLSPIIGQAAHFPVFRIHKATDGVHVITLHKRYQGCQNSTAVDKKLQIKPGSDQSSDLEYFHTYISNGLPLSAGVFRK
ncbi:MAG: sulfur oxidation c-type cytochrome SoxA [Gallionellales bacterium 35-53-114]|jgi:sulfur-oxidizing protein SoxA|nr:MAG: sulfur oxidation c-type cytochrome SoxA [Gallionellales bacterium 35-53-114]OYZ62706.1 MAG: sulfur oxidation c-type cytochrome SoxA [Gallionellales bacterium 24-53-125]OZB09782.1 MAG: sulfur oxidation c-type cytochrome SoxA [Gallionellales bacterium 39-52-133]HQS57655.1 sulfur oxidation c-type cytochrome SoxA [Gallionellaceae bacterium]HQS74109.1 sulfur oxidation c-type cytochrome SoxA [Gallionellaceae bacterium]